MEKTVRVLQFGTGNFGRGGQSTIVYNFGMELAKKNIIFDYFIDKISDPIYEKRINEVGGKVYNLNIDEKSRVNKLRLLYALINILRSNRYKIAHINTSNPISSVIIAFVLKIYGVKKIIFHCHSSGSNKNKKENLLKKYINEVFKEIIPILGTNFLSVSNKATERLYPSKLKSKVIILNNAIDIEKYSFNLKKREKLRKKFKIDENLKLIGAVGRFVQVKNYSFLVDVFNEISKKRKNEFKLMFIGEGELYREIREKVKKLDLEDKVLFIGQTDKVEDYYQMMDLFVMPSLYEGFPLVGVEAQANGLNCIFSETITNKINLIDNCTFAPLNKKEEWVDIILNMRINRKKKVIDILSNKGFNIKKNLELLERIYYEN